MHKISDFCKFQTAITLVKQLLLCRNLFLSDCISPGWLLIFTATDTSDFYNSRCPNYTFKTSLCSSTGASIYSHLARFTSQVSLQSEKTNFLSSKASWNLLMVLVLSLEPAHIMGASCSQAVSPLWTYFQRRVIIAGTTPQDEYLIPNRICLDSWISSYWDLLRPTSLQLDLHPGKLFFCHLMVNLQLLKVGSLPWIRIYF